MAARLRDRATGDEQARADEMPALDGLHQPRVGAAPSRTVVNPRISIPARMSFDCAVISDCGISVSWKKLGIIAVACAWPSISPGSNVRPARSTARAPAAGFVP